MGPTIMKHQRRIYNFGLRRRLWIWIYDGYDIGRGSALHTTSYYNIATAEAILRLVQHLAEKRFSRHFISTSGVRHFSLSLGGASEAFWKLLSPGGCSSLKHFLYIYSPYQVRIKNEFLEKMERRKPQIFFLYIDTTGDWETEQRKFHERHLSSIP